MNPLRIAVIGAGAYETSRSRGYQAVIKQLTDLYTLCAICDRNAEACRAAAETYDIPAQYTDVEGDASVGKAGRSLLSDTNRFTQRHGDDRRQAPDQRHHRDPHRGLAADSGCYHGDVPTERRQIRNCRKRLALAP